LLARSLLYMQPREGCVDDLIEAFERLDVPQRALQQHGCLSVELQVHPEAGSPVLVTALWSSRDAYDGWLDNPWRADANEAIADLLTEEPEGVVYDIRLSAGNPLP
jgi:quinol monooxygenase YgiN